MPTRVLPLICLAFVACFSAQAATAPKPAFAPIDVFALEWASDPQISPDGARAAYVRRSFDIRTDTRRGMIWMGLDRFIQEHATGS